MMLAIRNALCLGLLTICCSHSPAQNTFQRETTVQHALWTRYQIKLNLPKKWAITQDFDERFFIFPTRQHQILLRTNATHPIGGGWSFGIGMVFFNLTTPSIPEITDTKDRFELRPQQELAFLQKFNHKLSLRHRYWLEERFFEEPNEQGEFKEAGYALHSIRLRYLLELRYRPWKFLTLKLYDELFVHGGPAVENNIFNMNWTGANALFHLNKLSSLEIGYFFWYQQRPSGNQFFLRHIFRVAFLQSFKVGKDSQ